MADDRPWKFVAPWYRWQRQFVELGLQPRQTKPVFQKYDQPDFVKSFIKDPQHSLKFVEDVDRVFQVNLKDAPILTRGPFVGKLTRLYVPKPAVKTDPVVAKDATLVPTGLRKLYLDTHKRYYLVVCELHCDAPGFPTTTHDQVCQTGFVVRRRSFQFPRGARKEAAKLLQNIVAIQAEIAYLEQTSPARGLKAKRRAMAIQKMKEQSTFDAKRGDLESQLAQARQELLKWKDEKGVVSIHEGWIPGPFENIGSWQFVEEAPGQLLESIYPLYHLFPDPNIPDHSAKGKNIYFGVVPASSLDTDSHGTARFDDQAVYEVRCFVRRHKPDCPRRDEAPDCPGELVWSEPTESYRLASHNDLIGTSQRPITIQMPDLGELAAQVAALPLNKFSPLKVVQPQSLNFDVNVDDQKADLGEEGGVGVPQICFFAIPLITIVAFFVLKLFLPILVFMFSLFFLLQLKFCILPSVKIDAELKAHLEAIPPSLEADLDIGFDASLNLGFDVDNVNLALQRGIALDAGLPVGADTAKLDVFSNAALYPIGKSIQAADSIPFEAAETAGPDLVASLEYEERVEVTVK